MSRLIFADDLIEWINVQREQVTKKQVMGTDGSIFTRESLVTMQRCLSIFENKINKTATAFDVEKVVTELQEEKDIAYADFERYANDYFLDLDENVDDWYYKGLERAINVIRKGGVE